MPTTPVCNALWIGPALGPVERACLSSFVEAGHRVELHAYEDVAWVPRGVHLVDATAVLPREAIVRYASSGSYALFSNQFRYALLRAARGLWIDCDVLCLRAVPDVPFLFGWQDERLINGAVLKLPADHPALADLLAMFTTAGWVPPWLSLPRRLACHLRYRTNPGFGIEDMTFGTTGPRALTYYLERYGLLGRAQPVDAFYPIGWRESERLTRSDLGAVRACVTSRTSCIHLWSHARRERNAQVQSGSFLDAVITGSWREAVGEAPR